MSFTSHIVPIGEGWEGQPKRIDDPADIYQIHDNESSAIGAEGSHDDPAHLFTDTFVDVAQKANTEMEDDSLEDEDMMHFKKKEGKSPLQMDEEIL